MLVANKKYTYGHLLSIRIQSTIIAEDRRQQFDEYTISLICSAAAVAGLVGFLMKIL